MAQNPADRFKEMARRRRERVIILITFLVVAAVTYLENQVVDLGAELPMGSSILVFALININTLLLLLLIFLVFRNLVKLMVERRGARTGSRLRTSMVLAFVTLSLAPTILMFFIAFQFIGTSIEFWFSASVERSLFDAKEISDAYNRQQSDTAAHFAALIAEDLAKKGGAILKPQKSLVDLIEERRAEFDLAAVRVFGADLGELGYTTQSGTHISHLQGFPSELVSRVLVSGKSLTHLQEAPAGDYTAAVCPIALETKQESEILGAVAAFRLLPPGTLKKVEAIQAGLEGYRQLKTVKRPIKTTQFITLTLVTLLIIFAATWFGFHLAKTITVPLTELAQGTNRIAHGDYDFFIDMEGPDEIGTLVNAFNRMTADLKTSKARLDEAQREMAHTNRELERRRRYMEIVLRNVAAGVIAANAEGEITTINPSAERLLRLRAGSVMGRNWRSLLGDEERRMLDSLLAGLPPDGRGAVDRQLQINLGGESLTLMVHLSLLRDERGRDLGVVVVFEDLTELERAQRMAAWREVARRIAHEVKNPLTPIKLSAQRLVRRYQGKLGDDADVFDECTRTIITQVEELRRLVSEFSHFARLPMAKPAPADLADLVQEAVVFYRQAHPEVEFSLECESDIPIFDLDAKQMHRVLINLLENAVAAVAQTAPPQQVQVNLFYDDILKLVRLEVGDSGPGLTAQDKLHMFEPYFTTKKGGTGLGLAIASTIVTDHQGYIRVQDNVPNGARIIIELPVRNARENAANRIT